MMKRGIGAVLALTIGSAAVAAPPEQADRDHGFYFNRPGGTVAEMDADSARCGKLAMKTQPGSQYAGVGLMGALVGGIAGGIKRGYETRRNFETCMVVAGWRQVVLTEAEVMTLKAAVEKDRVAALTPLTGAEPVTFGTIGRVWANDYADPFPAGAGR